MKTKIIALAILLVSFALLTGCQKSSTCQEMCEERGFSNSQCMQTSMWGYSEEDIDVEKRAFNSEKFCGFESWIPLEKTEKEIIGWIYEIPSDCKNKLFESPKIGGPVYTCCCS